MDMLYKRFNLKILIAYCKEERHFKQTNIYTICDMEYGFLIYDFFNKLEIQHSCWKYHIFVIDFNMPLRESLMFMKSVWVFFVQNPVDQYDVCGCASKNFNKQENGVYQLAWCILLW